MWELKKKTEVHKKSQQTRGAGEVEEVGRRISVNREEANRSLGHKRHATFPAVVYVTEG
jgi:hypothetical protein